MEALLNIEETAKLLNVAVSTVYKMVCSKKLAHVKVGARVLFSPEQIRAWIEEHSVAPLR